jgi:hypothetical protein
LSDSGRGRGMKGVELYAQVRYAVQIEGVSRRAAARRFSIDPRTVAKMLAFRCHPGTGGAGRRRVRSSTRSPGSSSGGGDLVFILQANIKSV